MIRLYEYFNVVSFFFYFDQNSIVSLKLNYIHLLLHNFSESNYLDFY